MAGTLTISTLSDGTNSTSSTNCIQGSAKAWVNFNGNSGASPVIRTSYNVSSVTRSATGIYSIAFTTALTDANYVALAMNNNQQAYCNISSSTPQTSSTLTLTMYYVSTASDASVVTVACLR
jgi:hypothetical protein